MTYKIVIPYLQIGEFRVETPVGFSELITQAWTTSNKTCGAGFIEKYERKVFKNEKGQIVTRYSLKEVNQNKN